MLDWLSVAALLTANRLPAFVTAEFAISVLLSFFLVMKDLVYGLGLTSSCAGGGVLTI